MNHWKSWVENVNARPWSALGLLILLAIPATILLVFRSQDTRSSAALPNQLEAEGGVISSGAEKISDSQASGGQYVRFIKASAPTPTNPPVQTGFGPRPAPATPTGSNVYYIEDAGIADNGTGDVGVAISNFINSKPDGSIIVFTRRSDNPQGRIAGTDTPIRTYQMSEGIRVDKNLTLWGYGTAVKQIAKGDTTGSAFFINRARHSNRYVNARILGFEIKGPNPEANPPTNDIWWGTEAQMAVLSWGIATAEVADMHIQATDSDGYYIPCWEDQSPQSTSYPGLNGNGPFHFHHNNYFGIGRQGITLNQNYNGHPQDRSVNVTTIEYNHFKDVAMMAIDGEDCSATDRGFPYIATKETHINNNLFSGANNWYGRYTSPVIGFIHSWNTTTQPAVHELGPIHIKNNTFSMQDNWEHWNNGTTYWGGSGGAGRHTSIEIGPTSFACNTDGNYHDIVISGNTWTTQIPSAQRLASGFYAADRFDCATNVTFTNNVLNGANYDLTNKGTTVQSGNSN